MPQISSFKRIALKIGGFCVSLHAPQRQVALNMADREIKRFFCSLSSKSDLSLKVYYTPPETPPVCNLENKIFSTTGNWHLFRCRDKKLLLIEDEDFYAPDRATLVSQDFRYGSIYIKRKLPGDKTISHAFTYPLDQLLIMHLLSRNNGLLVHACGVRFKGKGILFVGSSGSGKTTIAKILAKDKSCTILNDDRIIVRRENGSFRIYGTPWHGTGKFAHPASAPLNAVFFLKHAKINRFLPLNPIESASRLFATCFSVLWLKDSCQRSLGLCGDLAQTIRSAQFNFLPRQSVVTFLKKYL